METILPRRLWAGADIEDAGGDIDDQTAVVGAVETGVHRTAARPGTDTPLADIRGVQLNQRVVAVTDIKDSPREAAQAPPCSGGHRYAIALRSQRIDMADGDLASHGKIHVDDDVVAPAIVVLRCSRGRRSQYHRQQHERAADGETEMIVHRFPFP